MSRILLALTSHGEYGDTGRLSGYYVPEAAHPWKVWISAGHRVDLVSTAGGEPPSSGYDPSDPAQKEFMTDPEVATRLKNTPRFDQIEPTEYDAVFFAGGHGTMWDFPNDPALADVAQAIWEAGGVVSAVCHGPAALVNVRLSDGTPLVAGRRLTAFTNSEEAAAEGTDVVPFLLQDVLVERGAEYSSAPDFEAYVVTDGKLVTGQNPASAEGVGHAVVAALG